MKKKLILLLIVSAIITIIIYTFNRNEKVYYLSLGDGVAEGMTAFHVEGYSYSDYIKDELQSKKQLKKFVKGFNEKDQRVKDLILYIEKNTEITVGKETIPIQQAINKADIITLSIGSDELYTKEKITEKDIKNYASNLEILYKNISRYAQKDVLVLGLYYVMDVNTTITDKINLEIEELCQKYHFTYIDTRPIINQEDYFANLKSHYITYRGHREISKKILEELKL